LKIIYIIEKFEELEIQENNINNKLKEIKNVIYVNKIKENLNNLFFKEDKKVKIFRM